VPPSLWIGPTSLHHPKTLAYTTTDPQQTLICFHLGTASLDTKEPGPAGVPEESVVLAVRHRPGEFAGSFSFTPEGIRRQPTVDQLRELQSTDETDAPARPGADRG
jgi:hypothetical protein